MSEHPQIYSMRAARQMDGATVEIARAQAAKARAEAEAAATSARLRAEQERRAAQAQARRMEQEERARERAARRARRSAAWRGVHGAVMGRRELLVTVAVIALSVGIALPAQIGFLLTVWAWPMAVAGGIVPESLTWAFAIQGRRREERGLSAGFHHTGTWIAALTAAGINLTHGSDMWGVQFGIVAALGSLAAPILWEAYRRSQSHRDDGLTDQERRLARQRRRHHRKVARLADRIRTASVADLPATEAWVLAWRAVHGAEPGITATLLKRHHKAAAKVGRLLADTPDGYDPVSIGLDVLARPVARTAPARPLNVAAAMAAAFDAARPVSEITDGGVYRTRTGPGTPPYRQASTPAPHRPVLGSGGRTGGVPDAADAAMERKRQAARTEIRRILADGGTPSASEIGRKHGLSREWGTKQIRAVKAAGLHLVPASEADAAAGE